MPPKRKREEGDQPAKKGPKNKRSRFAEAAKMIQEPGEGRNIQQEAMEKTANKMSKRELQGEAARYILYEDLRQRDQFIPTPEFLWLISAGIKSGKTQMMIGAVEKLAPLYYRVYYLSPQEEHEPKVKTHLLPLIFNKDYTTYSPENMDRVLNEMDEVHKAAKASKNGSQRSLVERANDGDDSAYMTLCVRQMFGSRGAIAGSERSMRLSREERMDRDKMLATGGRRLLILDDATMVKELRERNGDARKSFLGRLVRMRHQGIDMIIIVHNRGNASTVIKGSATVDTLFDPRSPADKKGVVENTSGLTMKGLESLVELAQSTSPHATITLYKGAPQDRRFAINLNTWVELGWDSDEPQPLVDTGPPKPRWAPKKVMEAIPAGRQLLARLRSFDRGGDPDMERGKDAGLADPRDPQDVSEDTRARRNARRRGRRAMRRFMGMTGGSGF